MNFQQYQAIIFDMDGVLIDSEPMWQDAQLSQFPKLGVPITRADTIATTGVRIDIIVQRYFDQYQWPNKSVAEVTQEIVAEVAHNILISGQALPGIKPLIELLRTNHYKLGLATSSPKVLIDATLKKLGLSFDQCISAEHMPYPKPHPEVYLQAAKALQVEPRYCLAIEDSITGMVAAKAAGMDCIVIPQGQAFNNPKFELADGKYCSAEQILLALNPLND